MQELRTIFLWGQKAAELGTAIRNEPNGPCQAVQLIEESKG
jgi:hypothetical protein